MPYASKHYPFEHKEKFEDEFPAQFIAEGLDQTRGWFYTLLILGVHLFGKAPFENVIVNGIVLAEDGKKMSKRLKNYPEPDLLLKKYGADAVRLYMINSPVVRAETLKFKEDGVREIVSSVLIPWKNSFIFLEQQVALFKKNGHGSFVFNPDHPASTNSLDNWIMASAQSLILYVKQEMSGRRLMEATLTIRISTVHCCTKTFTVLGWSYKSVYPIESTSSKGSIRKGRYSYCS
jgi:isoleucyl-tRNA synthetase